MRRDRLRERHEAGNRNVLGPRRRVKAGRGDQSSGVAAERPQALPQHFAPLAEGCLRHLLEACAIARERSREWIDPHQG